MALAAVTIGAALVLAWCTDAPGKDLDAAVRGSLERGRDEAPGGAIDFGDVLDGDWEALHVFAPLTPGREVAARLRGWEGAAQFESSHVAKDQVLLVFVDRTEVLGKTTVRRRPIDLACLRAPDGGPMITPADAPRVATLRRSATAVATTSTSDREMLDCLSRQPPATS